MSLTSSLYTGISGLRATGNSMQIIGDNLSNTNTTGFKSATYAFQDLLSQSISTQSGTAQIGRGTALGDISTDWGQGSFETTGNSTDLAISGSGFFVVRDSGSQTKYYTRAGGFSFDNSGNLVNADGDVVQGWKLSESGEAVGSVKDITLDSFTSPPQASSEATLIANLNSAATNQTTDLATDWDGTATTPIPSTDYSYQTSVSVYDSLGNTHDVTFYFDKDATNSSQWDYIVTCNPSEDYRLDGTGTSLQGTKYAGLLAKGSISFNASSGQMTSYDLETPNFSTTTAATLDTTTPWNDLGSNASNPTVDASGYFDFPCNFIDGSSNSSIALNLGTRWDGSSWVNSGESTTQYATESATTYQNADGYGAGALQSESVGTDGTITGSYSNGASIPLYRVALASFVNEDGLVKMGNSLYKASSSSGSATTNFPGTSGLGSISPNSLEQSNVDIASEFVDMIQIERTYQANSKIITTVDQMLSNTINMKQ